MTELQVFVVESLAKGQAPCTELWCKGLTENFGPLRRWSPIRIMFWEFISGPEGVQDDLVNGELIGLTRLTATLGDSPVARRRRSPIDGAEDRTRHENNTRAPGHTGKHLNTDCLLGNLAIPRSRCVCRADDAPAACLRGSACALPVVICALRPLPLASAPAAAVDPRAQSSSSPTRRGAASIDN